MDLIRITPVILTFNEAPNIERCLERLGWAKQVVVLDSGSTDDTLKLASCFANVRVIHHPFTTFARQWNFALTHEAVATEWMLAMDADYLFTEALVCELRSLSVPEEISAIQISFSYSIYGRTLGASLYPPLRALFRKRLARFEEHGHTMSLHLSSGGTLKARSPIIHDDRKPLSRWLQSQSRYMDQEAERLAGPGPFRWRDRLRKRILFSPFVTLCHCLFGKGMIFSGWAGWFYTFQRMTAELILSMRLLETRHRPSEKKSSSKERLTA